MASLHPSVAKPIAGSDESVEAPRASPLVPTLGQRDQGDLHDEPLRGAAVEQSQDLVNGFMVSIYIYITYRYIYIYIYIYIYRWNIIGGDIMEYNLMEYNEI